MNTQPTLLADPEAALSVERTPHDLFEGHFDAVYRFFSRRVASAEDAQDLAGDTFAAAVQAKCPRGVDPRCWLYGIARRKLADHLRRRGRERRLPAPEPAPAASGEPCEIRALVESLPEDQREALLLQALEDLTVEEIAQVMGRSRSSVKALLQRAKDRIRSEVLR